MPANPILAAGDVIEATIKGQSQAQGQEVINRYYFKVAGTPTPAVDDLADFLDEVVTFWSGAICPVLSQDYIVNRVELRRVSGVTPGTFPAYTLLYDAAVGASPIAIGGAVAGAPSPSFIAVSAWFQTGFVGRNWRGGTRLGTVPQSSTDIIAGRTNKWTAADWALFQAAADNFTVTQVTAGGDSWSFGVFSGLYLAFGLAPASPPSDAFADIIVTTVSEYVHHQNSRMAPKVP
jgi:hypothetical protein